MRSRGMRPLCLALVLGATFASGRPASAQDAAELQQARDTFQRALALQTGGDWAGALALLKEVAAVRSTPQVRFNIALCEENLGQLVAAVGDYELAAADARQADDRDVIEQVQRRVGELKGRIPKIVVERGTNADTATITLDGVTLGDQVIGKEMNVDPGPHVITARAAGFQSFRTTVRINEAETKAVSVTLRPEATPEVIPPPVIVEPPKIKQSSNTLAYVVGGLGLASLGTAGVMFALAQSAENELADKCDGNGVCPPGLKDTEERRDTYALIGNIGLGVGVVGVGLGVILLVTGDDAPETGLAPGAQDTPLGLNYRGQF